MIKYMTCTTCKGVVQVNNTGTCLRCQGGFSQIPQGDELGYKPERDGLIETKGEGIVTSGQPLGSPRPKRKSGRPRKKAKK